MSNQEERRPAKERLRGPNVATAIAAAAKYGRQLIGITCKPGGVMQLTFGGGGDNPPPGDTPEDLKALL